MFHYGTYFIWKKCFILEVKCCISISFWITLLLDMRIQKFLYLYLWMYWDFVPVSKYVIYRLIEVSSVNDIQSSFHKYCFCILSSYSWMLFGITEKRKMSVTSLKMNTFMEIHFKGTRKLKMKTYYFIWLFSVSEHFKGKR